MGTCVAKQACVCHTRKRGGELAGKSLVMRKCRQGSHWQTGLLAEPDRRTWEGGRSSHRGGLAQPGGNARLLAEDESPGILLSKIIPWSPINSSMGLE